MVLATPPLRLGLVLDRLEQPRWVCDVLAALAASSFAELVVVARRDAPAGAGGDDVPSLVHRLYDGADGAWLGAQPDPLARVSVADLVRGCAVVPLATGAADADADAEADAVRAHATDVLLDLCADGAPAALAQAARYGAWSFTPPDALGLAEGNAGAREVLEGRPVTCAAVEARGVGETSGADGRAAEGAGAALRTLITVFEACVRTHPFSARRNREACCREMAAGVLARLRALHAVGADALGMGAGVTRPEARPAPVGSAGAFRQLAGVGARSARKVLRRGAFFEQWTIAYGIGGGRPWSSDALRGYRRLEPPKDRFWADPFPLVRDGRRYVFLEEHVFDGARGGQGKGHISVAEVDEGGLRWGPEPVLVRDYHLSYPFLFWWDGALFMLPETALAGRVELYRCRQFPLEWELEAVLLDGVRAADATLVEADGRWWMFVSVEAGEAIRFDGLHLFHAPRPTGPWTPHVLNPVKVDVRAGRSAGALFRENGALYRPAQDGSRRYGYAVAVNRVTRLDARGFAEEPVARLGPTWARGLAAIHTVNVAGDLAVVDCLAPRARYP